MGGIDLIVLDHGSYQLRSLQNYVKKPVNFWNILYVIMIKQ